MPKAAKPSTRARKARADPLQPKSGNENKKAPSRNSKAVKETAASSNSTSIDKAQSKTAPAAITTTTTTTTTNDPSNYLLMVSMVCSADPTITRLLSVPPTLTFSSLHSVLQVAFGWADIHMHTFTVVVPSPDLSRFQNRVLHLYSAIAVADMLDPTSDNGFNDDDEIEDESKWTLRDVFERKEWEITKRAYWGLNGNKNNNNNNNNNNNDDESLPRVEVSENDIHIEYGYDMGDSWEHSITFLGRATNGLHQALGADEGAGGVLCIGGEGHPCAEDCGGEPGWQALKANFKKARGDAYLKEWYKTICANGEKKRGFDPYKWDIFAVNTELQALRC